MSLFIRIATILLLSLLVVRGKGDEELKGIKICDGTDNTKHGGNSDPMFWLTTKYGKNCTHIRYHLLIRDVPANRDLSFLRSIVEVYGSVIIKSNEVGLIPLTNLRVIRGMTRYHKEDASLFIWNNTLTTPGILDLRSLQSISEGNVMIKENLNLGYLQKVNWKSLFEAKPPYVQKVTIKDSTSPDNVSCSNSCEILNGKRFCWGPTPKMCQIIHRCANDNNKHCHVENGTTYHCDDECIGGCTGPSAFDCMTCKSYKNGGQCVDECPKKLKYNKVKQRDEINPDFRYEHGFFCVKQCPKSYYSYETKNIAMCRSECPPGYLVKGSKCERCKFDICPEGECRMMDMIDKLSKEAKKRSGNGKRLSRSLMKSLAKCTSVTGDLVIDSISTHLSGAFFGRNENVRESDMKYLSNIRHIYGRVSLQLDDFHGITNLSFFSSLESVKSENTFLLKGLKNLEYLGLVNLKKLSVPYFTIEECPQLCYMENFGEHFNPPFDKSKLKRPGETVRTYEACKKLNQICDQECKLSRGCWGPGPDMCVECKTIRAGTTCVPSCESENGYFFTGNSTDCGQCHSECKATCSGPGDDHCIGGCKHAQDNKTCVFSCPNDKFLNVTTGHCNHCSAVCSQEYGNGNRICTGSSNVPGPGGCNLCEFIKIPRLEADSFECVQSEPKEGYFDNKILKLPKLKNFTNSRTKFLSPCHAYCRKCSGPTKECASCRDDIHKFQGICVSKCPVDTYSSGIDGENSTDVLKCLPCHKECRGCHGSSQDDCKSCLWKTIYKDEEESEFYCNSTCPPDQPYTVLVDKTPVCRKTKDILKILAITIPMCIIVVIISIVGIILGTMHFRRRQARLKLRKETLRAKFTRKCIDDIEVAATDSKPDPSHLKIIGCNQIKKGDLIGSGAFGTVYKGVWTPHTEDRNREQIEINVAIKELREQSSRTNTEEFLSEARLMASVVHPYCMHLLGVCLTSPLMLISEYLPLGNLRHYIIDKKDEIGSQRMLRWSLHIAEGMEYLGSRGIIHRDLAARNVLLDEDDIIHITDFGLAKLNENEDGFQDRGSKLPVRWLAIECIRRQIFSTKSDVWAYGVTLWEIFSHGNSPYQDCPATGILQLLECGERLPQPMICTLDMYMLLIKCWLQDTESRPTFAELIKELKKMAADPGRYLIIPNDVLRKEPIHQASSNTSSAASSLMSDELKVVYSGQGFPKEEPSDNRGSVNPLNLALKRQISKQNDRVGDKLHRMKSLEEEDEVFTQEYEIPLELSNPSGHGNYPNSKAKVPPSCRVDGKYVNTATNERFTVHNNEYAQFGNEYSSVSQSDPNPVNEGCTLSWDGDGEYLIADVHGYQNVHSEPVL